MFLVDGLFAYFVMQNLMLIQAPYNHVNKLWMALLMVTAGLLFSQQLPVWLALPLLLLIVYAVRKQVLVGEREFLKGMIEHHEAAVLMARELLRKRDVSERTRNLAQNIIQAQTDEIADMQSWLA